MLVQSKIEYQYDGKIFGLANYQAQQGYIVFIIDLYGKHIRPKTNKEANEAMLPLRHNTDLLLAIMHQALTTLMK